MKDRKKAYSGQKHMLTMINIFLSPLILILFILTGVAAYFKNMSLGISANIYLNLLIFYALISMAYYLAKIPLEYSSGYMLEHKFSLSNQSLKDWMIREVKKGMIGFIISIPFVFLLYAFIKYWPLYWWALAGFVWFFMSILLAKFAPIVILPLFYKYSPIGNMELKDRLSRLVREVGVETSGVYEINMSKDTKKANAAVIGMGKQKRIVLCDTLLKNFSEDEIISVMGHELGHYKLKHVLKSVLFGGILLASIFFLTNIVFLRLHDIVGYTSLLYDFESLVLIYAIISSLSIITLPVHNLFSRKLEKVADEFTLKITDNKEAFISTMKKLADQNLADVDPGKFYEIMLYSHPPISKRIAFAESFKKR